MWGRLFNVLESPFTITWPLSLSCTGRGSMTGPPSPAHHTPSTFTACLLCACFFNCKKGAVSHTGSCEHPHFRARITLVQIPEEETSIPAQRWAGGCTGPQRTARWAQGATDTRTTGVRAPGDWKARPRLPHPPSRNRVPALRDLRRERLPAAPQPPRPAPSPQPRRCPGAPRPARRRCHRCARRSPESVPGVGVPCASGGVTGAREDQWCVGAAPPLPSDWPAPESRGRGLGRRAAAGLRLSRPRRAFASLLPGPPPPPPPWPSE